MEYQKVINLLDNENTDLSKFKIKNWVEINYDGHEKHGTKNIKFKTTMLKSRFCDYSNVFILMKGTITVVG